MLKAHISHGNTYCMASVSLYNRIVLWAIKQFGPNNLNKSNNKSRPKPIAHKGLVRSGSACAICLNQPNNNTQPNYNIRPKTIRHQPACAIEVLGCPAQPTALCDQAALVRPGSPCAYGSPCVVGLLVRPRSLVRVGLMCDWEVLCGCYKLPNTMPIGYNHAIVSLITFNQFKSSLTVFSHAFIDQIGVSSSNLYEP